jgi:hypothetical protein
MKTKLYTLTLLLIILTNSCVEQVKNEDRVEQEYNFSSIWYVDYKNQEETGIRDVFGSINVNKKSITVSMNINGNIEDESFFINTVTKEKDLNKLKYRTNKGEFIILINNNIIKEITFFTSSFMTTFYKKIVSDENVNHKLPLSLPEPHNNWTRVILKNVGSIDLSPLLEIQAGEYKKRKLEIIDQFKDTWGIIYKDDKLIFQPKGVNQYDESSLSKYCRIIVESIYDSPDSFMKLTEKISITTNELLELNSEIKHQIQTSFSKTPLKLVEWYPVKIDEINGMPCIHISYKRQLNDQPYVKVDTYRFLNYDRMHILTVSYRINEKDYWEETINNSIKSFRITEIN